MEKTTSERPLAEPRQLSFPFPRPVFVGVDFGTGPDRTIVQYFSFDEQGCLKLIFAEERVFRR